MAYNGSGVFLINSAGQPVVANTVISATTFNALTSDLATGLSTAITKDGQTTITNNIPFSSNKITGLGSGTAAADAANLGQVQSTVAKLITVTGTDTITGSMSPQLTAYATGQLFYFVANAANTGAVTLNIDSLGAKSITRDGSTALAAGDINSGEVVVVIYDGTRFQMINAANSFGNTTINGTLTVTGAATFAANPTLSGGTANGVLYLNGSKVATSGSAVTYDGTTFATTGAANFATSSGNVGIGTASPGTKLDVSGNLRFSAANPVIELNNGGAQVYSTAANTLQFASGGGIGTPVERMRIDSSGNVGIGGTPGAALSINKQSTALSGTGNSYGVYVYPTSTGATYVDAVTSLSGATSLNLRTYNNGTYNQFVMDSSGNVGIGGTASAYEKISVSGTYPTSSNVSQGFVSKATIPSGATSSFVGYYSVPSTQAAAFTCTSLYHFLAGFGTKGASSAITTQYGFLAGSDLTGATNNYGFYSDIASGSNRWNFYAAGTADNYFAGNVGIGTTSFGASSQVVLAIANATAVPTGNPTGGGVLYVEAGALKYRGSSGTVTTIANA